MKKMFILGLVGLMSLSSLSYVQAGGGIMAPEGSYGNDFSIFLDNVEDEELKDLVTKNILTISANTVTEDWEYNNKHFYTKKLMANVVVPEGIKEKAVAAYIAFTANDQPMYYDSMSSNTIPTTTVDAVNHIEVKMDLDNTTGDIMIDRADFDKYITNEYGTSFMGTVYLEFEDGLKLPFSNQFWLYLQKDNVEGKKGHLSNLYYAENQYVGYANMTELLQKVFEKLEKKLGSTVKYLAALESAMKKIDEKMTKVDALQKAMVESINTEDEFAGKVKTFGENMTRYNLLNDIKYNIGNEIQTKNSQGIIEEIFGDDIK